MTEKYARYLRTLVIASICFVLAAGICSCSSEDDQAPEQTKDNSAAQEHQTQQNMVAARTVQPKTLAPTPTHAGDSSERQAAAHEQGHLPEPQATGDPKTDFANAMTLLEAQGHTDMRVKIAMMALGDERPTVRQTAVQMLAGCESSEAMATLQQALSDRHEGVRLAAVGVLATIDNVEKDKLLARALEDPSRAVRLAATELSQRQDG